MSVDVMAGVALIAVGIANLATLVQSRRASRHFILEAARLRGRARVRREMLVELGYQLARATWTAQSNGQPSPVETDSEFARLWEMRRRAERREAKAARHAEAEARRRAEREGGR